MSGFNSVGDFYDVMAGRHGLHESEQGGGTLELYSYNGAEFPDGLDGSSLDVVTAPSPELLAYMRGNDSPVPPPGYKDMADEIKGIWDVYNHGSAEADWGRLADLYDAHNLSLSVIADYEFMDWPETLGDILNGKGSDCWNLDGDAVFEAWRDDADPVSSDMYFDVEKLPGYIETAKGGKRNA